MPFPPKNPWRPKGAQPTAFNNASAANPVNSQESAGVFRKPKKTWLQTIQDAENGANSSTMPTVEGPNWIKGRTL